MDEKRIELLQGMPVFGGIRQDTLERLLDRTESVSRQHGEYFIHQGERAACMYVLESGEVEVIKSWNGKDYLLRTYGEGDSFGEMALIDLFPRSASIKASGECKALEISHGNLLELYGEDVEQFTMIQMNIGREISRRLRALEEYVFRSDPGIPWPEVQTAV